MKLIIALTLLFITGCAANLELKRTDDGIIYEATCSGGAKCSYDGEDGKVELDSKISPLQGLLQVGPGIKP